jgi:ribosomal protein S12 methylthiotransferase accessory factor
MNDSVSKDLLNLIQLRDGIFRHVSYVYALGDEPRFVAQILDVGDTSVVQRDLSKVSGQRLYRKPMQTFGTGIHETDTLMPALGEAFERYSTAVYNSDQFLFASAEDLGGDALDLDKIPRLSKTELLHPRCPLLEPTKKLPIRWVRGISLLDGRLIYLPASMVYLYAGIAAPAERINIPITTGCAAHTSLKQALLGAICEVVERDAISLTWLQKLPLPRIDVDCIPPQLASAWGRYEQSCKDLEYLFFDATLDVGIPTIYALSIARANRQATTVVACATALNAPEALAKVIRDLFQIRVAFRKPRSVPASWDEFTDFFHGAAYMSRAEHSGAFDFLLRQNQRRPLSEITPIGNENVTQSLPAVLSLFRRRGMDVYAVDLSTDEAIRAGIWAVRVIIPALQPLGFYYRARYLGHSRLYEAPERMGFPVHSEEHLNHWPQPFA